MNGNTLILTGCAPVPLAHYLKALGILRLVAEQKDPNAKGCWQGDTFVLHSAFDETALLNFFLHDYRPTPIIAPWNGGSGFYPKDNQDAIEVIAAGNHARFTEYRLAIHGARATLASLGMEQNIDKEQKNSLLDACRSRLSDEVIGWLDAAFVVTD